MDVIESTGKKSIILFLGDWSFSINGDCVVTPQWALGIEVFHSSTQGKHDWALRNVFQMLRHNATYLPMYLNKVHWVFPVSWQLPEGKGLMQVSYKKARGTEWGIPGLYNG
jgi:hypothetical protein